MTIAIDRPDLGSVPGWKPIPSAAPQEKQRVVWSSPAESLWVAETPTGYLGMVDRNHDGYVATSFDGQDLGVFAARADAQLAVYSHWFLAADRRCAPEARGREGDTLYQ